MDPRTIASLIQEGGRVVSGLLNSYGRRVVRPIMDRGETVDKQRVTLDETVGYQCREIAKELILLEGHLTQGCKINDKACDCCEKHPIKIEGLAQEASGMISNPIFGELVAWTRKIAPITTEDAAASGEHDQQYQGLAAEAREFRKAIMAKEVSHETV